MTVVNHERRKEIHNEGEKRKKEGKEGRKEEKSINAPKEHYL